jgi:polyisoprenyl-teichoic acid--peptidoglycan teichoic acid transferase
MYRRACLLVLVMLLLLSGSGCNYPAYPQLHEPAQAQAQPTATLTHTPQPTPYRYPEGFQTPTPFQPHDQPEPTPEPTATPAPRLDNAGPLPTSTAPGNGIPPQAELISDQDTINFLLIGSDKREGTAFRTDTLILAAVRPKDSSVTLVSIPRDLYVYIPGWEMNRVNTAYFRGEYMKFPGGGPALLKETLRYNLGIRVDHMALVDFDGFRKVVDALDGIDVPLTCPYTDWRLKKPALDPEVEDNWALYTVSPGLVHMDGDLALWYARSRSRSNDFDRGRRQQEVLRAVYERGLQLNVIPRLPDLYAELRSAAETDVSLNTLLALAPMATRLDAARIRSYYIHDKLVRGWRSPTGAAVLLPKSEEIAAMLHEALGPPGEISEQRLAVVVEVLNGTTSLAWDRVAAERLHYAGYETHLLTIEETIALLADLDAGRTLLYDLTEAQDGAAAAPLLAALGLPEERLRAQPMPGSPVAYRLVLGADYRPCFNPAALSH